MRRLARHLFTLCSAVSLLLCVAMCVLWVRSYFVYDLVEYHVASPQRLLAREWDFVCNRGVIGVHRAERRFETAQGIDYYLRHGSHGAGRRRLLHSTSEPFVRPPSDNPYDNPYLHWLGFSAEEGGETKRVPGHRGRFTLSYTSMDVPYWLLALLLSAPLLHRVKIRRPGRGANQEGQCPDCGYDLRASPERCPECGTVPAAKGNA